MQDTGLYSWDINVENKEDLTKSKALLTNPELLQYIEDTLILRSQNDDDGNYDSYRGR